MPASPRRTNTYDRVAEEAASVVLRRYSNSFSLAAQLLGPRVRQHAHNIYGWARLTREIVHGEASAAGLTTGEALRLLGELEDETNFAIERGYSGNLIVHAFALTARETGFDQSLTSPVFDALRADLNETVHDEASFVNYVHGSAEVLALMCLRAILEGTEKTDSEVADLEGGARALGAAFLKIDLLSNLGEDFQEFGRSRFSGVSPTTFDESEKLRLLEDIDDELRTSSAVIPNVPADSRRGVVLVQALCMELATRLRATDSDQFSMSPIRLPNAVRLRLAAAAATGWVPKL